jgi:HAMP domain-containing protein
MLFYIIGSVFIVRFVFNDKADAAPVLRFVLCAIGILLIISALVLRYLYRRVSKPVHDLILACDAISRGKFDTEIIRFNTKDEIGLMADSLHRMVEQLRIHMIMRERSQNLLDMYTRLHRALYRDGRMEDVFDEVMPVIGDFFVVRKATLVCVTGDSAGVAAYFEPGKGMRRVEGEKFLYHRQAAGLVAGKKYVSLNANAMREQKIGFAGEKSLFLCILPFLAAGELRGYLILEGDGETGPVVHNDAALLFLSETISFMLSQREAGAARISADNVPAGSVPADNAPATDTPAGDAPADGAPEDELPVIKAARAIGGLDVDKGLFHSGGAGEQYGDLLRISAKSFAAKTRIMRDLCAGDLPAFGIEIHGMKGALNAIGAGGLGERARELEFAAKAGDAAFCAREYPAFEEQLAGFAARLEAITKKAEAPSRGPGSIPELVAGLEQALEASRMFDSAGAGERIASLRAYSWENYAPPGGDLPPVAELLERIADALECMDYDGAERDMGLLLECFKPGEPPEH